MPVCDHTHKHTRAHDCHMRAHALQPRRPNLKAIKSRAALPKVICCLFMAQLRVKQLLLFFAIPGVPLKKKISQGINEVLFKCFHKFQSPEPLTVRTFFKFKNKKVKFGFAVKARYRKHFTICLLYCSCISSNPL